MHNINLNLVKPSPNPIRKSWDEQKMQELAQSIKEQGVIVPIKVRPVNEVAVHQKHALERYGSDGDTLVWDNPPNWDDPQYEVVYGHRRVEAAKRAGLGEIPAIVESVEDDGALIQALIENLVREDMIPYERALGLRDLKTSSGWSGKKISDSLGWKSESSVNNYLALLKPELQESRINEIEDTFILFQAQAGLGKEHRDALPKIIDKSVEQELNRRETRAVADAYAKADTPELKEAVLNTSGKLGDADRILQVAQGKLGKQAVLERYEEGKRLAYQEWDSAVKDLQDYFKLSSRMIKAAKNNVGYDRFSPEAAAFTIRKIDSQIEQLQDLREVLANVSTN